MDSVRVNKEELIEKVEANRVRHIEKFDEAVQGYRDLCVKQLEEHIERIKNGAVETVKVSVPAPKDHTSDYDTALTMLKMSVDDRITINDYTFQRLVMDEWEWKQQFEQVYASYTQSV